MCMFLCMYRISISIFAKFQNLLTSGLYCLRKQREKRGWKKACQQVNCALGSHSENGEKIMLYKNNCVYNLVLTNLMLWGAGLWFLSPRKGTYSGFFSREGMWSPGIHQLQTRKSQQWGRKHKLPAEVMPISCIVLTTILQEWICLLETGPAILQVAYPNSMCAFSFHHYYLLITDLKI